MEIKNLNLGIIILKMTDHKKTFSGVKIVQHPGGNSNCPLNWGHQSQAVKKNIDQSYNSSTISEKNPEKYQSSNSKVVEHPGEASKNKGLKIVNPPGGKSSFTFG